MNVIHKATMMSGIKHNTGEQEQAQANLCVGIVGAGKFGSFHAAKYDEMEDVHLVGVHDLDLEAASKFARQFSIDNITKLDELIKACDAIIVTTPARSHTQIAMAALKADCHVFIEKPIALTLEDADQIIRAGQEKSLTVQIGHQEHYVADALGLFDLPERPREIVCRRCMPTTGRGEDVSAVIDMMIHDLDIIMGFAGLANREIKCVEKARQSDDEISVEIIFPEIDMQALCVASRRSKTRERTMELSFKSGNITLDFLTRQLTNNSAHKLKNTLASSQDLNLHDGSLFQGLAIKDPLSYGAHCFISAIRAKSKPLIDGHMGRAALSLALDIEKCKDEYLKIRKSADPLRVVQESSYSE